MRDLDNRRKALDAQIAALTIEAEERAGEVEFAIEREKFEAANVTTRAQDIAASRGANPPSGTKPKMPRGR